MATDRSRLRATLSDIHADRAPSKARQPGRLRSPSMRRRNWQASPASMPIMSPPWCSKPDGWHVTVDLVELGAYRRRPMCSRPMKRCSDRPACLLSYRRTRALLSRPDGWTNDEPLRSDADQNPAARSHLFEPQEIKIEALTKAINAARTASEKMPHARDLIDEVNVLAGVCELRPHERNCGLCRSFSELRLKTAKSYRQGWRMSAPALMRNMRDKAEADRYEHMEHSLQTTNLADILERVLDKGIVIAGDITISLVEIDLLNIKLRLLIASVDKAKELGINWWETDPKLSCGPMA